MNKNMDKNKGGQILLEKNSSCYVFGPEVLLSLLELKGLKQQDVKANLNSNSNIKYTIPVFCFIKSPDLDGGKKWHYDYHAEDKMPKSENGFIMGYKSTHNVNGHGKLVRTSGLMFMLNVHQMESSQFEEFVTNIKKCDSETQIKMLEEAGYKKFTVKLNNKCDKLKDYSFRICNNERVCTVRDKLELINEKGEHVDDLDEVYLDPRNYDTKDKSDRSEYINPAHMPFIHGFDENKELDSIIILNKNAEMKYYLSCNIRIGDYENISPFHAVKNKAPLTFYCEPGSKVAIDILSKFKDKEKYPEFYNATIVFMSPKLVAKYQKNLDDVDNYQEMREFITSYKENEDYFSFKMSDYHDYSQQRIDQLSYAQTNRSNTWEDFVEFIEVIGAKEKSDVKYIEPGNENVYKNNEIRKSDNEIEIELELEDKEKTLTQDSCVDDLRTENDDVTENLLPVGRNMEDIKQNVEIKTGKNKDNKIDEPEENLSIFMRYLKNHLPRIFKFINAIRRFFSRFKSKSKIDDKNSLGNIINKENQTQSLIDKTLGVSSQKHTTDKPKNMETSEVLK